LVFKCTLNIYILILKQVRRTFSWFLQQSHADTFWTYGITTRGRLGESRCSLPFFLSFVDSIWCLTLLKDHSGYQHACRAFCTWISSLSLSSLSVTRLSLLSSRVLTTLSLCSIGWCELKFRYWSVCVGFLQIWSFRSPSSVLLSNRSRKGNLPSCSTSYVNFMLLESSKLFKNSVSFSTDPFFAISRMSSTYLFHNFGFRTSGAVARSFCN